MCSQSNNQNGICKAEENLQQVELMGKDVLQSIQSLRELLDARAAALSDCRKALENEYAQLNLERSNFVKEQMELCATYEVKEKELSERESRLKESEELLATKSAAIEKEQKEFESSHLKIIEQTEQIQQQINELDRRKSEINEAEEKFARERSQLEAGQEALANAKNEIAQKQEELKKREMEISNLTAMLEQKRKEIETREAALAATQHEWDERMKDFTITQNALASLQHELSKELSQVCNNGNETVLTTLSTAEVNNQAKASMERFQKLCRDARRKAIGADMTGQNA